MFLYCLFKFYSAIRNIRLSKCEKINSLPTVLEVSLVTRYLKYPKPFSARFNCMGFLFILLLSSHAARSGSVNGTVASKRTYTFSYPHILHHESTLVVFCYCSSHGRFVRACDSVHNKSCQPDIAFGFHCACEKSIVYIGCY